jgi:hypothetical protein
VQVIRENPISSTTFNDVAGLNQWVWNLLRTTNPNSVFLNYQLVDVLWANSPAVVSKASPAPLTAGNPLPNPAIHKVANTTIETYFQNTFTCLDCHTHAAIASPATPKKWPLIIPSCSGRQTPRHGRVRDGSTENLPQARRACTQHKSALVLKLIHR